MSHELSPEMLEMLARDGRKGLIEDECALSRWLVTDNLRELHLFLSTLEDFIETEAIRPIDTDLMFWGEARDRATGARKPYDFTEATKWRLAAIAQRRQPTTKIFLLISAKDQPFIEDLNIRIRHQRACFLNPIGVDAGRF